MIDDDVKLCLLQHCHSIQPHAAYYCGHNSFFDRHEGYLGKSWQKEPLKTWKVNAEFGLYGL
jgi:hypothetical protein